MIRSSSFEIQTNGGYDSALNPAGEEAGARPFLYGPTDGGDAAHRFALLISAADLWSDCAPRAPLLSPLRPWGSIWGRRLLFFLGKASGGFGLAFVS
ncbi:hypothetical protein GUJ93_ZPchr0006g44620 [Zizania palustris]|uniref:Uncharacterized protein n=1 Tax=Zizania palustris TaxID=103762 RepID=A0A8J5T454_ZIZPA|nr:hypothetical protein GUJ93_ZPchr0006g44620 [Zizania palustris]